MQLSDELVRVRFLADEPDPTGRFSDAEIASHLNAARRDVSLAVRFPEIQINGFTAVGLQEYAVSEDIIEVKRVYVAGVRTPRTDIATLEGEAIGLYNNAWQSAPLAFYPISNDLDCGYPAPTTMPFFTGMRSMWYPRGPSVVGLVAAPASVVPLRVEGIALAPDLVNDDDIDVFPRFYLNTICWGAIGYMKFADSDTAGYQWAQTNMGAALGVLIDQIKSNNAPQGTRMLTYRSVWNVGNYGGGRRWR